MLLKYGLQQNLSNIYIYKLKSNYFTYHKTFHIEVDLYL